MRPRHHALACVGTLLLLVSGSRVAAQPAQLVRSFCATGGSFGSLTKPVDLGGVLIFGVSPCSPATEYALWRSDGTTAGTYALKTFASLDSRLQVFQGKVYFGAAATSGDTELWSSDGTAAGTTLVKDVEPGAVGSAPDDFRVLGTKLIFAATTSAAGRELWITDGTSAGTALVLDILPGTASSNPDVPIDMGGRVYFAATTTTAGRELWVSDGTAAGTRLVAETAAGTASGSPVSLGVAGSKLYFQASDGTGKFVYTTNGATITKAGPASLYSTPRSLGTKMWFRGTEAAHGAEPWVSDGTVAGTALVKDINPGTGPSNPIPLVRFATNVLILSASDGASGIELWRSDGTAAGTTQIADLAAGSVDSGPAGGIMFQGYAYFRATTALGAELWRTDGTAAGTSFVQDLVPGAASSTPLNLVSSGGRLFLTITNGTTDELWTILSCPSGQHPCGQACVSNTGLNSCGTACTPCPAPKPGASATCDGTSCAQACEAGLKDCGDRCAEVCCTLNSDCRTPPDACHATAGLCDDGVCAYGPLNGSRCDADQDRCTPQDRCQDGVCTPDPARVGCVPLDCREGACNPGTGDCEYAPVADGSACGDNGCYATGVCTAGVCSGAQVKTCALSTESCHVAYCDASTGQCALNNALNGESCTATDACLEGGLACEAGACTGTKKQCPVENDCRIAECLPATGACDEQILPDGTSCVSGCAGAGSCLGGACDCGSEAVPIGQTDEGGCTLSPGGGPSSPLLAVLVLALASRLRRGRARRAA